MFGHFSSRNDASLNIRVEKKKRSQANRWWRDSVWHGTGAKKRLTLTAVCAAQAAIKSCQSIQMEFNRAREVWINNCHRFDFSSCANYLQCKLACGTLGCVSVTGGERWGWGDLFVLIQKETTRFGEAARCDSCVQMCATDLRSLSFLGGWNTSEGQD